MQDKRELARAIIVIVLMFMCFGIFGRMDYEDSAKMATDVPGHYVKVGDCWW